jgi:hypothetical protein
VDFLHIIMTARFSWVKKANDAALPAIRHSIHFAGTYIPFSPFHFPGGCGIMAA